MRQPLTRAPLLLALLAVGSGCDLWAPARGVRLPPSSLRVGSASTSFREYRYAIPGFDPTAAAGLDAFDRNLDDIVVTSAGTSTVTLFRNEGDGSFRIFATWETCPHPDSVDGEDLAGHGHDDFLVTCADASTMSLFTGDGKGGFIRKDIATGEHPIAAQSAPQLSSVGSPYLAVLYDAPSALELFFRDLSGYARGETLPTPEAPTAFTVDILDRDRSIGYAIVSQSQSRLSTYLKDGMNYVRTDYEAPEGAAQVGSFDLRGQTYTDLVVASGTQNSFRLYLNDGTGHFPKATDYVLPHGPAAQVGSSHLRGNAQPELYFQSALTGEIIIYPNVGDGTLSAPEVIAAGASLTAMITGRFAHVANDMDIAVIDRQNNELVVLLNEHPNY